MTTTTTTVPVLVTGNTYPVKDAIKALGGRWDAAAKGWRVPAARAAEAQAPVARAPQARRSTATRPSYYSRPRGRWTGCSCGSIEDAPRPSDCDSCRHDY